MPQHRMRLVPLFQLLQLLVGKLEGERRHGVLQRPRLTGPYNGCRNDRLGKYPREGYLCRGNAAPGSYGIDDAGDVEVVVAGIKGFAKGVGPGALGFSAAWPTFAR